ncbi:MAG: class I SAM-dependent methyltransferase [Lentihominibacter sp.]|nr:class I SAM-dependent methyltransferase [Lentihominibacter sp.]
MKNIIQSTTELALHIARPYIREGKAVVDATCGNGHDTVALAKAVFPDYGYGAAASENNQECPAPTRLIAFDIQQRAIDATASLLTEAGFGSQLNAGSIRLIRDSHENMDDYVNEACLIMFNLGYLPGGDKELTTCTETTMKAIQGAAGLLTKGGLLSVTMYSGHPEGAKEKAEVLAFARGLDSKIYHAAYVNMLNQANNPPELLLITRKR